MIALVARDQIQPGYSERLVNIMRIAGHREHGISSTLVGYLGLSRSGYYKLLQSDKPPASTESINNLADRIVEDFKTLRGLTVTPSSVLDYLLYNASLPANVLFSVVDPSLAKSSAHFIEAVAGKIGFDLNTISQLNFEKLNAKISHYCAKNAVSELNDRLESIIQSLLNIAAEDELL